MTAPNEDGRATVREVYALVNEVRDDLGKRIDHLSETVDTIVASHEHRLTIQEQVQAIHSERLAANDHNVKEHADQIAAINTQLREDEAATRAINEAKTKRQTTRRWVVGTILSLTLIIVSVLFGAGVIH